MKKTKKPIIRFSDFKDDWEQICLSDFGNFKNGLNKDKSDFGHGVPFVNLMDVFGKSSIREKKFELVNATQKEIDQYNLQKGDVLFIRSSVKREGVGEAVLIEENLKNTVYSGFLIRFREKSPILNLLFKKYCFSTFPFRKQLLSYATTSANTNINQDSLSLLKLMSPGNKEQLKIADFLSSVDMKIEKLIYKRKLLNRYKSGVLQKIFSQEVRFKDENGKSYPDWTLKKISQVTDRIVEKVAVDANTKYQQIGIRSHGKGIFHKEHVTGESLGNKRVFWVQNDVFIVNIVFAWEQAVAKTTDKEAGMIASHRFPMYKPQKGKLDLDFLLILFLTKKGKYLLELASPGGAGRNKTLGQKEFEKLKIEIPSYEEQLKISSLLKAIDKKIELVNSQLNKTQTFKKGLLQQMFV